LERCTVWLRDLDINNIGAEVIGALRNVVLEENGEDKIAKESNKCSSFERIVEKKHF
jgi:hypothetical protein